MKVITDKERYVILIEKDEILSLVELGDGKVVIQGTNNHIKRRSKKINRQKDAKSSAQDYQEKI